MYQGKLTYATGKHAVKAKFWSNFVTQSASEPAQYFAVRVAGVRATGVDYGTNALAGMDLGLVGYGYNGWGLGTSWPLLGWPRPYQRNHWLQRQRVLPRAITSSPATPTRSSSSATATARAS